MDRLRLSAQDYVSRITAKRLLIAALLFWLPVVIFARIASEILERQPVHGDSVVLTWVHSASSPFLDQLAIHVTNAGDFLAVIALAVIAAGILIRRGRPSDASTLIFGVGGAVVLNEILKLYFRRPRPTLWHQIVDSSGYSFPSGHAMMSSALAISFILIGWKSRWRYLILTIGLGYIGVIGLSRMYLGVHFPTDIAAGWCVSLVWVLIVRHIVAGPQQSSALDSVR
jgi:membrane-associated phospholipid phosphatase